MEPISQPEVNALVKLVNSSSILNKHLQQICATHGLKRTGVKADLQRRIVNVITRAVDDGLTQLFYDIKRQIHEAKDTKGSSSVSFQPTNFHSLPQPPSGIAYNHFRSNYMATSQMNVVFKPSPFYEEKTRIGDVKICEEMSQHRNTVTISFKMQDYPDVEGLVGSSRSHRVLVYCAADYNGPQDIAFPHQSEFKVNGEDVRNVNLRGLKNKHGSTRPVDISAYLRLRQPIYMNTINFTYALTNKLQKFYLVVQVCKVAKVEDLVTKIKSGPKIRKLDVVNSMRSKAQDADIEATSQVMSLKCPLSYMRLNLPCRGMGCKHVQCFDATSYLQLQEQGPQWVCPVCNNVARFDQLAVDEYVLDILSNTAADVNQVTIDPDGKWRVQGSTSRAKEGTSGFSVIDDIDVSEIKHPANGSTPARSVTSLGTPSVVASRESTVLPRSLGTTSAKRPAPVVIDLTLDSDDDDDTSQPPTKRQQLNNNNYMGRSEYYEARY